MLRFDFYRGIILPCIFSCFLVPWIANAVELSRETDSLRKVLYGTDDPAEKIRVYLKISLLFENVNPDSAMAYLNPARNLAKQVENPKLTGEIYYSMGNVAVVRNQLDLAFSDFRVAAIHFKKSGDTLGYARMLMLQGNIFGVHDDEGAAMTCYMEAISLSEKYHYNAILSHLYNNMGAIYMQSSDQKKALEYFTKALGVFIRNNDSANLGTALLNIGVVYKGMGDIASARGYVNRAIEVYRREHDDFSMANSLMTMGMVEIDEGNFQQAAELLDRSMALAGRGSGGYQGPRNVLRSEILIRIGINFLKMGKYELARNYLLDGYNLARSMKQPGMVILATENLSKCYENLRNDHEALYYYKIFMRESDSLSKAIMVRSVELTEVRQEYLKKQKEDDLRVQFEQAGKRTVIVLYIVSGVFLLAVIVILFLLLKLERRKKHQSEIEKKSLDEKLENQTREITTNVMYINKMNEQVLQIAEKLKTLVIEEGTPNAQVIRSIIKELAQGSGNDPLKEFEVRFQKIHSIFYKNLTDRYPDLTPNELKLCAFLRLNMSTKEISALTYQTENSIMVARTRLRQKLDISRSENLVTFLSQF
jgi:tetratricopeptide (TPR) repeat protein